MKETLILFFAFGLAGCASQSGQISNNSNAANAATAVKTNTATAASHGGTQPAHGNPPAAPMKPSGGDAPMMTGNAKAIDTSKFDADIAKAEKDLKAKPTDEAAKRSLATAYAQRGFELTGAAQYRAALGDFRKCLKLDPNNAGAKKMHDQIVEIFESLGRPAPKEGEEPPPLPFDKKS